MTISASTLKKHLKKALYKDQFRFQRRIDGALKQKTAEKYSINNNIKYILTNNHYIFSDLYAQKDKFSAFDYEITEAIGYGRKIFDNDIIKWHLEAGPGGRHSQSPQENLSRAHQDELILHTGSGLIFKISQNAAFSQDITYGAGKDTQNTKSTSALKATVLEKVSLKLSHRLEYNAKIPNTGKPQKHAENTTSITATYMF